MRGGLAYLLAFFAYIVGSASAIRDASAELANFVHEYDATNPLLTNQDAFTSAKLCVACGILLMTLLVAIVQCIKGLPIFRSLPISAMLSFALTCVGYTFSVAKVDDLLGSLAELGFTEDFAAFMTLLKVNFIVVVAVNTWALALGLFSCGFFREGIYGADSWLNSFGKFMVGPVTIGLSTVVLWLTLAVQLLLSHVFLVASLLLIATAKICGDGHDALINEMTDVLQSLMPTDFEHGPLIKHACHAGEPMGTNGLVLCMGCLVTVLSQMLMLSGLSASLARIEEEMKKY